MSDDGFFSSLNGGKLHRLLGNRSLPVPCLNSRILAREKKEKRSSKQCVNTRASSWMASLESISIYRDGSSPVCIALVTGSDEREKRRFHCAGATVDMSTAADCLLRFKIVSLGKVQVGKSCLIKRYCEKRFVSKYMATIGIDYGVTRIRVRNYDIQMNIFDCSGHPLFYEVRNEFYRDVQAILLVFDLSNRRSFEALEYWLWEIRKELNLADGQKLSMLVFVVGNKNDLKRTVDDNEARIWANLRGYPYFETSGRFPALPRSLSNSIGFV